MSHVSQDCPLQLTASLPTCRWNIAYSLGHRSICLTFHLQVEYQHLSSRPFAWRAHGMRRGSRTKSVLASSWETVSIAPITSMLLLLRWTNVLCMGAILRIANLVSAHAAEVV